MLSADSVAVILYALATGFPDRAVNVVAMSDEIDEPERAVLWTALTSSDDRSEQARRFGDALRSTRRPTSLGQRGLSLRLLFRRGLEDAVHEPAVRLFHGEPRRKPTGQVDPLLPDLRTTPRDLSWLGDTAAGDRRLSRRGPRDAQPLSRSVGADRRDRHRRRSTNRRRAAHRRDRRPGGSGLPGERRRTTWAVRHRHRRWRPHDAPADPNRSRPSFRSWPMAASISSRTRTRRIGRRTSTRTIPRRHSSAGSRTGSTISTPTTIRPSSTSRSPGRRTWSGSMHTIAWSSWTRLSGTHRSAR